MTLAIDVRGLHKRYGRSEVLTGLDLAVETGTVFALLGPNGAGKTTLISILSTLTVPDSGTALVAGHDVVREPAAVRRCIALTGQSAAVDGMLSGAENIRMLAQLSGLSPRQARDRARELLAGFGLLDAAEKPASSYSGGMRRRLDLALSLVVPPRLLFLDEPTTGLDTRSRLALWQAIRSLREHGTTVMLTTQYLEEADQLADRIAVLDHGVIVAEGTAAELKARVGGEIVEVRTADGQLMHELSTDGTIAGLRAVLDGLGAGAEQASVTVRKPSLDDVFLALTGSDAHALKEAS